MAGEDNPEKDRRPVRAGGCHDMAVPDRTGELQPLVHLENDTRRIENPADEQEQKRVPGQVIDHRLEGDDNHPAES